MGRRKRGGREGVRGMEGGSVMRRRELRLKGRVKGGGRVVTTTRQLL